MNRSTQRFIVIGLAALALTGCAGTGGLQGLGGTPARPKTIMVADFVLSSDVAIVDRGYTARLERKVGAFPTFERKPRTIERVNDELVASIIATLREAGLDAQPGNEDSLKLGDEALLVGGRIRPSSLRALANGKPVVFGSGRVAVDVTVSAFSSSGKKPLFNFIADTQGAGKAPAGKEAAARNAAITEALAAQKAPPEKLSPNVEVPARQLGRAAGDKIVAYAKEQGWLTAPEGVEAQTSEAQPEPEQRVRLPDPKPPQRPARRVAQPAQADPQAEPGQPKN
ncbi:MAG: hypothetical protein ACREB2_14215 [Pseudolabrys sp.]